MRARILALALAAFLSVALQRGVEADGSSFLGQRPPPLGRTPDIVGILETNPGKPGLVLFFNDSPESARELRNVRRVYRRYRGPKPAVKASAETPPDFKFPQDRLVVVCVTADTWTPGGSGPSKKLQDFVGQPPDVAVLICTDDVKSYGITSYPQMYLVGRDGKVVREGKLTMDAVAQVVEEDDKADSEPPKAEYSDKFDAVLKAVKEGDFSKAAVEVAKLETTAGPDGENAKAVLKWIEARGAKLVASGDAAKAADDVFAARDFYATVEKHWPVKSACAKDAKAKAAALRGDQELKPLFTIEKTWNDALAAEKAKDTKKAADLFRKCAKATTWQPLVDRCEEHIDALGAK